MVSGAWFRVQDGQVIEYGADSGLEALDRFLAQDPQNQYLGEVALVDNDSPVVRQNRFLYSIVFDENALSHIALGSGYPHTFESPQPQSEADFEEVQMNSIKTRGHKDIMIGSPTLNVTAETYAGATIPIMVAGKIVLGAP